jgi:hypothetical protein
MATKEEIKLQNEYNDALKLSSSVTSGILADIKEMVGLKTKLGKSLQSEVSSLQSSEDIQAQILKNEDRIKELSSVTAKNKVKKAQKDIESLKTINKSLSIEAQMVDVIKKVDEEAQNLSNSLSSGLDGFIDDIKSVPVFGKIFGRFGDFASGIIKNKIGAAAQTFTTTFATNIRTMGLTGKTVMASLGTAGSAAGSSLVAAFSGPQAIIAAIIIGIGASVFAFYKLASAAKQFREETGLLNSQTKGLESQIGNVVKRTAGLGASTEDVAQAASAFSREFGNIEQASDSVLTSVVTLNKNYGVGVEEATRLNKVFQNIGGLSAEQSQFLVAQTSEMARMAGVAPRQVIQDMAESAEYAYKYFQGSPEKLRDAAVQAAKLGTSIKEAGKVADNLLDFENSITKELEASAILGTNLNFGRARYLASTGKIFESQQAVNDEVSKLGDLTKLNTWQQQALSEATGMEYESLVNQQRIREQFGKLDEEKLSAALAYAKTGKDITKLSMKDLDILTEEQKKNQEMQSQFDQMGNRLKEIGMQLLVFLAPIGEMLFALFDGILSPALNAIQGVFDALAPLKTMMADIFGEGAGIADIFKFIGTLIGGIIALIINLYTNKLKAVLGIVTGIWNVVKGIFTGDFELIFDGLMSIGMGALRLFRAIPMILLDTFFDMFPKVGDAFTELFTSIGSKVKQMFTDMLPSWAVKLLGGGTSVAASATPPATESINDGVIQNGKVVSTHPEDFLIATKNPSGLAESMAGGMTSTSGLPQTMSGGTTISMEGVIAELRELKAAFMANKDVYMDRAKVTTLVRRTTERATDNNFGTLSA